MTSFDSPPFRVGIDVQALQTAGSRHRGIGRYVASLIEAMVENSGDRIEYRFYASDLLPAPEIVTGPHTLITIPYQKLGAAPSASPPLEERLVCESLYKTILLADRVDGLLLPSPMEMSDSVVPDLADLPLRLYVVCHDLIPLLNMERDFGNATARALYERRLRNVRHADAIFSNSEATKRDVVKHLGVAPERVHTIYAGISPQFTPLSEPEQKEWAGHLREKFGVGERYVMYSGGENWRKNMEGLIRAWGQLPRPIRDQYQLVLTCHVSPQYRDILNQTATKAGVRSQVVVTGFVSDDELRALYGLCNLFVFPSLYEGFGLPLAEAMACGAPAIAADNSSLPEVIGDDSLLFDASSPADTARKIASILDSPQRLTQLKEHGRRQAATFTWQRATDLMLPPLLGDLPEGRRVFESANASLRRVRSESATERIVPFFSPMPPAPSGISDYSAELVPELSRHMKLVAVAGKGYPPLSGDMPLAEFLSSKEALTTGEWESRSFSPDGDAAPFDLPLFQMGNSDWHSDMYAALLRHGGVTVMHDYNLNNLLNFLGKQRPDLAIDITAEVAHHYRDPQERREVAEVLSGGDHRRIESLSERGLFTNRRIFTRSLGVILHSDWAYNRAVNDFGNDCPMIARIPHLMPVDEERPADSIRMAARSRLNLKADRYIVGTVGYVHATKRSTQLLDGFRRFITEYPDALLVFIGSDKLFDGDFGREINRRGLDNNVMVTGFVPMEDLYSYVDAADVCVSLRYPFGGETSGGLLRIMARGKACIVSDIGSFGDYPSSVVHKIPAVTGLANETDDIAQSLTHLRQNAGYRDSLGNSAYEYVRREHDPSRCARLYSEFFNAVRSHEQTPIKLLADFGGREGARANAAAGGRGASTDASLIARVFAGAVARRLA